MWILKCSNYQLVKFLDKIGKGPSTYVVFFFNLKKNIVCGYFLDMIEVIVLWAHG